MSSMGRLIEMVGVLGKYLGRLLAQTDPKLALEFAEDFRRAGNGEVVVSQGDTK